MTGNQLFWKWWKEKILAQEPFCGFSDGEKVAFANIAEKAWNAAIDQASENFQLDHANHATTEGTSLDFVVSHIEAHRTHKSK